MMMQDETEPYDDAMEAVEQEPAPEPFDYSEKFWLARPYFSAAYASEVYERFGRHAEMWSRSSPIADAVMNAYRTYHGLADTTNSGPTVSLMEAGEKGEFLALTVNHFRGLVRHQIALVTADRPTWEPQARTSDSESAKQVELTRNLLDYVMSAKRFDQKLYDQTELALVPGSGFQALGWDASLGLNSEGDIWGQALAPWEVRHEDVRAYEDCSWWIFRRFESRWNWVAQLAESDPEKAQKVAAISVDQTLMCGVQAVDLASQDESDRIPVLYVYANATKACPNGRVSIVAGEDLVLLDGPSPYGASSPIVRMCPSEFMGSSIPCADSWSLLPLMEAYNAIQSMIMTRVDLFGVPDIAVSEGAEFEQGTMGGANLIKGMLGQSTPQLLDMLQIPNALAAFGDKLKSSMEELSGINSVTRGNPSENITSGSMAALMQSMAIQFNSAIERAYTFNLEAIGTHLVRIYQTMASEKQLISIAGTDEQWVAREFQKEDLSSISRVAIRTASALSKTVAGRYDLATQLLQQKVIEDPRQYLQVVATGNLTPIFKGPVDELVLIKGENERIRRGQPVVVMDSDNPKLHIREHRNELSGGARYDPEIAQRMEAHIAEHVARWQKASMESPDICVAFGYEPLPGALAAGQAAAAMQGPTGAPPPDQNGPAAQKIPGEQEQKAQPGPKPAPPGKEQSQAAPSLPSLPTPPEV